MITKRKTIVRQRLEIERLKAKNQQLSKELAFATDVMAATAAGSATTCELIQNAFAKHGVPFDA